MSDKPVKKVSESRRKFIVKSAAGIGVIFGIGYIGCSPLRRFIAKNVNSAELPYRNPGKTTLWFEVNSDNQVIFHCPKVEMGQGVFTGLAQIAAEELQIDVDKLIVQHAITDSGPIDSFATGGSTSISSLWFPLRELAATFRQMIIFHAAEILQVEESALIADNAIISGAGHSISFLEVASQVTDWKIPSTPELKPVSEFKYVGKPIARVDLKAKVFGDPIYGIDAHVPGMLYGSVARPHMVDSTFAGADFSKAMDMPGVIKIVLEDDFVGVIATSKIEAQNARKAIVVNWKVEKIWQQSEIESMIEVGKGNPVSIQKEGNLSALDNGKNIYQSEYRSPVGAHAHLEPNGALADVTEEKTTVYISTQVVSITKSEVAKRLNIKKDNVVIVPQYLGGGFGRRLHTPNAVQAAVMSKAIGKPVHCFFDRKQEFQNDTFRPPTHHVLKAVLSEKGTIDTIEHNVSSGDVAFGSKIFPAFAKPLMGADLGAWRGGMFHYENIPNYEAISWRIKLPFATSWWRALGLLANTFAIESFMDELAEKAGMNPIEFRLKHIKNDERGKRLAGVIKAARDQANYSDAVVAGRAMGFACSTDVNTPVAQIVELSMENDEPKIHKVTCAIDPGIIINPDQVKAQCEGAIIMGISASMYEEMQIKDGSVVPTNYGHYRMALMKNSPKDIDVVLLQNGDSPRGVGEPPLGPIGAAIANAMYKLTGVRNRNMPLVSS